jgi:hypothetical protein
VHIDAQITTIWAVEGRRRLPGAGIREFRDAVHHRPGRTDAETAGPQAHAAQMRAASKFGTAILMIQVSI